MSFSPWRCVAAAVVSRPAEGVDPDEPGAGRPVVLGHALPGDPGPLPPAEFRQGAVLGRRLDRRRCGIRRPGCSRTVPNLCVDLLCAGHTFLADGRLMTLGGWDRSGAGLGLNEADIFEPNIQAWIPRAGRWPTSAGIRPARACPTAACSSSPARSNSLTDLVTTPEVYDPGHRHLDIADRSGPVRCRCTRSCSCCLTAA